MKVVMALVIAAIGGSIAGFVGSKVFKNYKVVTKADLERKAGVIA